MQGNWEDIRARKKLDRYLEGHTADVIRRIAGGNGRTHPSKIQSHHEHDMGGKNDQEIPRRIPRNGVQQGGGTNTPRP